MEEWCCWPCMYVMAGDERRDTGNRWGNAPYHWSQEMSGLPKCKATSVHGRQWLKYIFKASSVGHKNNPQHTHHRKRAKTEESIGDNNHRMQLVPYSQQSTLFWTGYNYHNILVNINSWKKALCHVVIAYFSSLNDWW